MAEIVGAGLRPRSPPRRRKRCCSPTGKRSSCRGHLHEAVAEGTRRSAHHRAFGDFSRCAGFECGRAGATDRAGVRRILLNTPRAARSARHHRPPRARPPPAGGRHTKGDGPQISVDKPRCEQGNRGDRGALALGAPLDASRSGAPAERDLPWWSTWTARGAKLGAPDMRTTIACALECRAHRIGVGHWISPRSAASNSSDGTRFAPRRALARPPRRSTGRHRPRRAQRANEIAVKRSCGKVGFTGIAE